MIVGPLAPTHSRLRIPSSRLCLYARPPVQCLVPSLGGHYLYGYFQPHPISRLPHSTLPRVHLGRQRQRLSGPSLQRRRRSGRPEPTHLAAGAWPISAVRYEKCQFSGPLPMTPKFFVPKIIPWHTGVSE